METSDESILAQAKKHAELAKNGWSEIYQKADEDLRFLSDDPAAQWDEAEYTKRKTTGRPVLAIDQISQFVHQVVNDIRMNTPTIKTIPHSGGSDVETAEVIDGIIKDIEYESGADEAYDTAASFAVKCSIGFIRVDHDYVDDETFDQRLCIKRIINHKSVLLDPSIIEIDGSDAKYGFIFDPISVAEFRKEYPGKEACSFDAGESANTADLKDDDEIMLADYYRIEETKRRIAVDADGNIFEAKEGAPYEQSREVTTKRVRRYKLSGKDVLAGAGENEYFPGKYIPIVPVFGEEAWENGKRKLLSLARKAKSSAYMFNLWKSLETETLMKQPMAPVMAAAGQIEAFAADWQDPAKAAALRYETHDAKGNPLPAPQRLNPPTYPVGFAQASRGAIDDIKGTLGMYNASLGQRGNESSGVAINARKAEGDVATFHFGDNLTKSIAHVGRVIVSAIPEVYDAQRVVRMIDGEENPKMVGINGALAEKQERSFDLTQGKYSVRVITGAPFTTQRQEAAAVLADIGARNPQIYQIAGDILFKNMDFPGAQALAERFKKTVPKELLEPEEGEEKIDPEKMQMQQAIQQMQQQLLAMQQQMQVKDVEAEMQKAQGDLKNQAANLKAQEQIATLKIENQQKELQIAKMQAEKEIQAMLQPAQQIPPQNMQ